jgi:hypothetical protein
MSRLNLLYPFFFAILPVLNVVARSPGGSSLIDAALLSAMMLGICGVFFLVAILVTRKRWPGQVPALLTLAAVFWFYGFDWLRSLYRLLGSNAESAVLTAVGVLVLAAVTVVAVRWLGRRPPHLERASTFFTITGMILVAWSGARITSNQVRSRAALRNSELVRDLRQPIPVRDRATAGGPRRDIYLVILDEYANSSVLQELFGFDNAQFEDSLRTLGFIVPPSVHSNYVHTLLSIPSVLNFSHLTRLEQEIGPKRSDATVPNHLVENNRTTAFLESQGYEFLFFPSQWWISTRQNRNADWVFEPWSGFHPGREATRSDMRRAFVGSTPLGLLRRSYAHDADHVGSTLRALEQVPSWQAPTFAFAHVLNPHHPYVFDASCRVRRTRSGAGRDSYVGQVQCLNRLLLGVVTTLLERSSPQPIIILMGDHGTNVLRYSEAQSASAVSTAQARERFGAFGAFYVPGSGNLFTDSVTHVNVMSRVLNHYFGAGLPLAPDNLYMSTEQKPYGFVRFDAASLSPDS